MRKLRHLAEAAAIYSLFGLFRLLPVDAASALGGFIVRSIGPCLPSQRVAMINLGIVFPHLSQSEKKKITRAMWNNFGRVCGEYPHLKEFLSLKRIDVVGQHHIDAMRDDGKPGIMFTGHFNNWEIAPLLMRINGMEMGLVFRAPNNRLLEWLILRSRRPTTRINIPKGPQGAKAIIKLMQNGGHLGVLIDQKMNDGIEVPFFGLPAMTAPGIAQMALKYGAPLYPIHTRRLKGATFRVTVSPPLDLSLYKDPAEIMGAINRQLELWIRDCPEQWLWIHKRWDKSLYR